MIKGISVNGKHSYYTVTNFLTAILNKHNAQTSEEKRIYLGSCDFSSDNTNSKTTAYRNTLEEIKVNLIDRIGGEIRIRKVDGKLVLDFLWDMNEIIPSGITSSIKINATEISGNNMTIKNLVFDCTRSFSIEKPCVITKLNFLNIYTTTNSNCCFYTNTSRIYFRNCKFSGIISHGYFLDGGTSYGITFTNDTGENPKGCSFNLEFCGKGQISYASQSTIFTNCNIHISGKNDDDFSDYALAKCCLTNCYISGKCPSNTGLVVSCKHNVYNIEVPKGKIIFIGSDHAKTVINDSLVNSAYNNENAATNYLIKATAEQMYDTEYFKLQGFPIA